MQSEIFYSTNSINNKRRGVDDKYLSYITPINPRKPSKITDIQDKKTFSAMDIETMEFNGKELPISISIKTKNITKLFIIDLDFKLKPCFRPNFRPWYKPCSRYKPCYRPWFRPIFRPLGSKPLKTPRNTSKIDLNTKVKDLWDKFFDFILINCNKEVIFVHNLGNFDGFFIYKALSNRFKPDEVSCLIDSHNKFIQITLNIDTADHKLKIV